MDIRDASHSPAAMNHGKTTCFQVMELMLERGKILMTRHSDIQWDVETVIKNHREVLDGYNALTLHFWCDIDKAIQYDAATATFTLKAWNLHRLTSPEAITRAFRRVLKRNAEKYGVLADKWRQREEEGYRSAYSSR